MAAKDIQQNSSTSTESETKKNKWSQEAIQKKRRSIYARESLILIDDDFKLKQLQIASNFGLKSANQITLINYLFRRGTLQKKEVSTLKGKSSSVYMDVAASLWISRENIGKDLLLSTAAIAKLERELEKKGLVSLGSEQGKFEARTIALGMKIQHFLGAPFQISKFEKKQKSKYVSKHKRDTSHLNKPKQKIVGNHGKSNCQFTDSSTLHSVLTPVHGQCTDTSTHIYKENNNSYIDIDKPKAIKPISKLLDSKQDINKIDNVPQGDDMGIADDYRKAVGASTKEQEEAKEAEERGRLVELEKSLRNDFKAFPPAAIFAQELNKANRFLDGSGHEKLLNRLRKTFSILQSGTQDDGKKLSQFFRQMYNYKGEKFTARYLHFVETIAQKKSLSIEEVYTLKHYDLFMEQQQKNDI